MMLKTNWYELLKINIQRGKILNWTYFNITEDFKIPMKEIIDQMDNYRNLENNSYWRSKMTDEERKMRSHPNRSSGWIPNRLEKQRDELRHTLLEYVVGPDNYKTGGWWSGTPCSKCDASYEIEQEAMKLFSNTLEEELGDKFGGDKSLQEYTAAKEKGLLLVYDKFGDEVAQRLPYSRYQQGTYPTTPSRSYGMCNLCYKVSQIQMKKLVDSVWDSTTLSE